MKQPARFQVGVIGASLAGSTTALTLARAGISTVLLDKKPLPARKACGEGLSERGVQHLQTLGFKDVVEQQQHLKLSRYHILLNNRNFEFQTAARGYALGVERNILDRCIFDAVCARSEVQVSPGQAVREVTPDTDGFTIRTDSSAILVQRLVIAAGANNRLIKAIEPTPPVRENDRVGVSFHLQGAYESIPSAVTIVLKNNYQLYCTPVSTTRLNVALLGTSAAAQQFRNYYQLEEFARELYSYTGFRGIPLDALRGSSQFNHKLAPNNPGIYTVGDCRQCFDPIGGTGMTFALGSGMYAASAIIADLRGHKTAQAAKKQFERAVRKEAALGHVFTYVVQRSLTGSFRHITLPLVSKTGLGNMFCKLIHQV